MCFVSILKWLFSCSWFDFVEFFHRGRERTYISNYFCIFNTNNFRSYFFYYSVASSIRSFGILLYVVHIYVCWRNEKKTHFFLFIFFQAWKLFNNEIIIIKKHRFVVVSLCASTLVHSFTRSLSFCCCSQHFIFLCCRLHNVTPLCTFVILYRDEKIFLFCF